MSSREQFESYICDQYGFDTYGFARHGDGYKDDEIDGMWQAWQASRKALESAEV
jgi:hypothetical protein